MDVSRRDFLKKTSGSIAIGVAGFQGLVRSISAAAEATRTYKPMTKEEVAALLARTRTAALNGQFELYKTTSHFDGTGHNPQWLG